MKNVSKDSIDDTMYNIYKKIVEKRGCGCDMAAGFLYPLHYYIATGRAPSGFLKSLVNLSTRQQNHVAFLLCKGGSDYEIMEAVKEYVSSKAV